MQKLVIGFFAVFLTSRFFTETIRVAPKAIDLLDLAFVPFLFLLGLVLHRPNRNNREVSTITGLLMLVVVVLGLSCLINADRLLVPAAVLFVMGFMAGPMLFVGLNKTLGKRPGFHEKVWKLLVGLFFANLAVVFLLNIPSFLRTKNPDDIAGTFGLNAYFFSAFLVIAAGFFIGLARTGQIRQRTNLAIQITIVVVYYLLQYRSALPFFLAAYLLTLVRCYNRQILKPVAILFLLGFLLTQVLNLFTTRVEADLKYDSWVELVKNPGEYMTYGKFSAYRQTALMMADNPASLVVGVGPGNYLSRAYYTFSYELVRGSSKGVGRIIEQYLGISQPRFTQVSEYYLAPTRTGAVFGSKQLSNPNSSFLAPIAEIGLVGGLAIIFMHLYLCWKAWRFVHLALYEAPAMLPVAAGFLAGAVYLAGLGFLDNVWEMTRATLPVWFLFYATLNGVREHRELAKQTAAETAETEPTRPDNLDPMPETSAAKALGFNEYGTAG